jgi:hypothetical protein
MSQTITSTIVQQEPAKKSSNANYATVNEYLDARAFLINSARVYLSEARSRRAKPSQRAFGWVLLSWAAAARRELAAMRPPAAPPKQQTLF